eukprot:gene14243-21845_t
MGVSTLETLFAGVVRWVALKQFSAHRLLESQDDSESILFDFWDGSGAPRTHGLRGFAALAVSRQLHSIEQMQLDWLAATAAQRLLRAVIDSPLFEKGGDDSTARLQFAVEALNRCWRVLSESLRDEAGLTGVAAPAGGAFANDFVALLAKVASEAASQAGRLSPPAAPPAGETRAHSPDVAESSASSSSGASAGSFEPSVPPSAPSVLAAAEAESEASRAGDEAKPGKKVVFSCNGQEHDAVTGLPLFLLHHARRNSCAYHVARFIRGKGDTTPLTVNEARVAVDGGTRLLESMPIFTLAWASGGKGVVYVRDHASAVQYAAGLSVVLLLTQRAQTLGNAVLLPLVTSVMLSAPAAFPFSSRDVFPPKEEWKSLVVDASYALPRCSGAGCAHLAFIASLRFPFCYGLLQSAVLALREAKDCPAGSEDAYKHAEDVASFLFNRLEAGDKTLAREAAACVRWCVASAKESDGGRLDDCFARSFLSACRARGFAACLREKSAAVIAECLRCVVDPPVSCVREVVSFLDELLAACRSACFPFIAAALSSLGAPVFPPPDGGSLPEASGTHPIHLEFFSKATAWLAAVPPEHFPKLLRSVFASPLFILDPGSWSAVTQPPSSFSGWLFTSTLLRMPSVEALEACPLLEVFRSCVAACEYRTDVFVAFAEAAATCNADLAVVQALNAWSQRLSEDFAADGNGRSGELLLLALASSEAGTPALLANLFAREIFGSPTAVSLVDSLLGLRYLSTSASLAAASDTASCLAAVGEWIDNERVHNYLATGSVFLGGFLLLSRYDPTDANSIRAAIAGTETIAQQNPLFGLLLWQNILDRTWDAGVDLQSTCDTCLVEQVRCLWVQCASAALFVPANGLFHATAKLEKAPILAARESEVPLVVSELRCNMQLVTESSKRGGCEAGVSEQVPTASDLQIGVSDVKKCAWLNDQPQVSDVSDVESFQAIVEKASEDCRVLKTAMADSLDGCSAESKSSSPVRALDACMHAVLEEGEASVRADSSAIDLLAVAFTQKGKYVHEDVASNISDHIYASHASTNALAATQKRLASVVETLLLVSRGLSIQNQARLCQELLLFLSSDAANRYAVWARLAWVQSLGIAYDLLNNVATSDASLIDHCQVISCILKLSSFKGSSRAVVAQTLSEHLELRLEDLDVEEEHLQLRELVQHDVNYLTGREMRTPGLTATSVQLMEVPFDRMFADLLGKLRMRATQKVSILLEILSVSDANRTAPLVSQIIGAAFDTDLEPELPDVDKAELKQQLLRCLASVMEFRGAKRETEALIRAIKLVDPGSMTEVTDAVFRALPKTDHLLRSVVQEVADDDIFEWLIQVTDSIDCHRVGTHRSWLEVEEAIGDRLPQQARSPEVWDQMLSFLVKLCSGLSANGDRGRTGSPLFHIAQSAVVLSFAGEDTYVNRVFELIRCLPSSLREGFISSLPWFHATFHHSATSLSATAQFAHLDSRSRVDLLDCLKRLDWAFLAAIDLREAREIAGVLVPMLIPLAMLSLDKTVQLVARLPPVGKQPHRRVFADCGNAINVCQNHDEDTGSGSPRCEKPNRFMRGVLEWLDLQMEGLWHPVWTLADVDFVKEVSLSQIIRNGQAERSAMKNLLVCTALLTRLLLDSNKEGVAGGFVADIRLLLFCVLVSTEHCQAWLLLFHHHTVLVQYCLIPLASRYASGQWANHFVSTMLSCLSIRTPHDLLRNTVPVANQLPFAAGGTELSTAIRVLQDHVEHDMLGTVSVIEKSVLKFTDHGPPELCLVVLSSASMLWDPSDTSLLLLRVLNAAVLGLINSCRKKSDYFQPPLSSHVSSLIDRAVQNLVIPPASDPEESSLFKMCLDLEHYPLYL